MRQIKIEIEIPELNFKGEIKPLKSYSLLRQLEEILDENNIKYKWCMSSYEDGENDGETQNV
jgi:hypothetical protein